MKTLSDKIYSSHAGTYDYLEVEDVKEAIKKLRTLMRENVKRFQHKYSSNVKCYHESDFDFYLKLVFGEGLT